MSPFAHITGWGMAVPDQVLTNREIAQRVDTSDEWIVSHTGICERRIAGSDETTASLAFLASARALEVADLDPGDLDLIIVSTSSPEHLFPATACLVQDRLGAEKAGAFDLLAACSGFIYALNMATQAIRTGAVRNALVVGAETLSRLVDWNDRNTCILFGDGAGAFVLQAGPEKGGVISAVMHSDGSGGDLLIVPGGGSRIPTSLETVTTGEHFMKMNGREVFRFAARAMDQATREALEKASMSLEDIQLVIPHQANLRIIEAALRIMEFPKEQTMINLDRYGNTSTASIPIATCEAIQQGRLQPGDNIVFVGFGAGLTWGAAVAVWSGPKEQRVSLRRRLPLSLRLYGRLRSPIKRFLRRIDTLIYGQHNPFV